MILAVEGLLTNGEARHLRWPTRQSGWPFPKVLDDPYNKGAIMVHVCMCIHYIYTHFYTYILTHIVYDM